MELDDALDALYGVPLEEFTAVRNDLAKELADAGDSGSASKIKALKKPNLVAWAVNQIARRRPDDLARLFELRQELEDADGPQEIRKLGNERRSLVAGLVTAAREVLEEAGHAATAATTERISQTLLGVATEDDRSALLAGRLSREITSTGIEAFAMDAGLDAVPDASPRPSAKARREVDRLKKDADEAEREAQRLTEEAKRLEEEARAAMEAAAEARREAIKARDRARRADRDL